MESLYKEIEKSFPKIEKLFSAEFLIELSHSRPDELEKYNFGFGAMIRLKLLSPKSRLYKEFVKKGVADRDEISAEIIRRYHEHLRGGA